MSKKCLVIPREVLLEKHFTGFMPKYFHDYLAIINQEENQRFLDRYETSVVQEIPVEEDPSLKQPIPYIVVMHLGKVFVYERAPPGVNTEARLASKLSIGVGGHIEPFDDADNLIISSIKREIQEELGYFDDVLLEHKGYINFEESEVDKVHFGLIFKVEIKKPDFSFDNSEIVHGRFTSVDELKSQEIYGRLENWSKALVDNIDRII